MDRKLMCWILIFIIVFGSATGCSGGGGHHGGGKKAETPAEGTDGNTIPGTPDALSATIVSPSSDTTIAVGEAISFQGSNTGGQGAITCVWSFDGVAPDATQTDPGNVSFPTPGSFTITFTAEDDSGTSSGDTVMITVVPDGTPVAEIAAPASNMAITPGQTVRFQGFVRGGDGDITCFWSFGGAAPVSTLQNPGDVIFSTPGSYTVTFTAVDSDGDASSDTVTITVARNNSVPVATITSPVSDTNILAGQSVPFQGSVSGGDGVITYAWSFGGAAPDSTLQNPGVIDFSTPGRFEVVFTARDSDGDVSSDTVTITVAQNNTVPVATITSPASDMSILAGQSVIFQGSVSAGDGVLTYAWSFGGAAPVSNVQKPGTVVFSTIGSYIVVFTVTDSDGDASSDTVTITVARNNTVPVAAITSPASDMSILAGESVTFQGSVSGGDGELTYAWSFGGVAPDSNMQNPGSVPFSTPGRYTIVFTARDSDGDASSDSVAVTVEEDTSPTATIASPSADATIEAGQSLLFLGSVSGGNGRLSYRWSFAGGAMDSRVKDPGNVRFLAAGMYTVTFTVTDSDGDTGSDSMTVTVNPVTSGWISVDVGYGHTAAIKSDGSIWAWGNNNSGQLGDGTLIEKIAPVQIGDGSDWRILTLGFYHTLSLKQDGTLWAWGENASGQIGNGTLIDVIIPVQIGSDSDWTTIDAGYFHNLALKTDGSLWAWGYNPRGQLGNGSTTERHTPTRIGEDSDWTAVSAGAYHSVALKGDGSLWAWGYNSSGQLGDGTGVDKNIPTRIGSDTDWIAVSAGVFHTIALKSDGSLWAWGFNSAGQLGDGTLTTRVTPTRIGNENTWVAVSAGSYHSMALKSDCSVWVWGSNSDGQLGDGSTTNCLIPQRLGSAFNWVSIAAGVYHSVAYKNDGSLWAWGNNSLGQLGDGTKVNRKSPVLIVGN